MSFLLFRMGITNTTENMATTIIATVMGDICIDSPCISDQKIISKDYDVILPMTMFDKENTYGKRK